MATRMGSPPATGKMPVGDRRAVPNTSRGGRTLRRLRGLLTRPLGVRLQGIDVHFVLVERRRPHASEPSLSPSALRAELQTRLLNHTQAEARYAMRHLMFVLRELERTGWAGVQALPMHVRDKALVQADMLAHEAPSPALLGIVERLRLPHCGIGTQAVADLTLLDFKAHKHIEISEATFEDFEQMERGWISTLPPEPP
jgi:hypothetical protein